MVLEKWVIFPISLPTIWYISSHYGSGKENRQTELATATQIHLTLDLLLSLSTNSVINILKNTPFCLQISIIDMQMATNTQRQNPWRNFLQTTQHQPLENVQEILSVLLMTSSWLYIMVWTSSPFSRHLLSWLSKISSPLALCCSPDPSWPSHPQLCNILTHEDVLHTIFFLFVLVLT